VTPNGARAWTMGLCRAGETSSGSDCRWLLSAPRSSRVCAYSSRNPVLARACSGNPRPRSFSWPWPCEGVASCDTFSTVSRRHADVSGGNIRGLFINRPGEPTCFRL
jgi:hypothetical protein